MSRTCVLILAVIATVPATAAEPYRAVLTDVERNTYLETLHLAGADVTPGCPIQWSLHKYVLRGGKQEGVEVIELDNGRFQMMLVPTRGMSIQKVTMGDMRLGWDSPVRGPVHPKFVNLHTRQGLGWLEGFNEWMVRCGLEFFGAPGTDEFIDNTGQKAQMDLTLHGKAANIPASKVELLIDPSPPYRIRVRGRIEETCMHGPKLELWTELSTTPGSSTFTISDTLTNRSALAQEFGILYHCNYGTPLMEKDAAFVAPVRRISPINETSARGISTYDRYPGPTAGIAEEVFCMQLWADEDRQTMVMLRNAAADRAVSMAFSVEQLPFFTLWKNPVAIEDGYVTGLEPGTGFSRNRSVERKSGRVPKLEPHQTRSFKIDFTLLAGTDRVRAAARAIAQIRADRKTTTDDKPLPVE